MLVRTGLSAALIGDEMMKLESPVAVKPKHASAQLAMQAASSVVFCVLSLGALWWWSQSGIALDADTSVIVVVAPAANPDAVGSVATDRATSMTKTVRPMRMFIRYFIKTSN